MKLIFPSHSRPLTVAIFAFAIGGTLAAQPLYAQPTPQQEQAAVSAQLKKVREQAQAMRKADPKGAAALIQKFVQEHQLDPDERLDVLVYMQTDLLEESGQKKEAVQMLDFLIAEGKTRVANGAPLAVIVRPQTVKMRVLAGMKQPDEAAQVLAPAEDWQRIVQMLTAREAMQAAISTVALGLYLDALENDGKNQAASEKSLQLLQIQPLLLSGSLYSVKFDLLSHLVRELNAQNQNEAALSWAKVAYLLAPFDNAALEKANKLLAQSWGIDNYAALRAFTRAQEAAPGSEDAQKNPLFAVPLPAQVLAMQDELHAQAAKWAGKRDGRHDAISFFLLAGDWHAAMQTALAMWRDDPASNEGIGEINRVFKANDLSPVSGNAFIAFLDDAKGENPVKAFLAAHPPRDGAAR